jgi:hypothetical protein
MDKQLYPITVDQLRRILEELPEDATLRTVVGGRSQLVVWDQPPGAARAQVVGVIDFQHGEFQLDDAPPSRD